MSDVEPTTVFCVIDNSSYYGEPVTIRIFDSKGKAVAFCSKNDPCGAYLSWEEIKVE